MLLADSIDRLLISQDGAMTTKDPLNGTTCVQTMQPLGTRYEITSFASAVVLDPSEILDGGRLFVGRLSRKAVCFAWTVGHDVRNWQELLAIQLVLVLTNMFLFGADFYLTNQGLHGFIAKTPILTYDLTAGTERRKVVLALSYAAVSAAFRAAPFCLALCVNGTLQPSGAYMAEPVPTIATHMFPYCFTAQLIVLFVVIADSLIHRKRHHGTFLLDLSWTNTNGFLVACGVPRWITGISLDASHAIKIGNKLFVKPSLQVVLGSARPT
ncbi:hypothetical protein AC1031_001565 [Aphanomyces cochlioides]|nr:hypothetical protein AC1031_001565 [Aphanomyces cochlioides]